MTLRHRLALFLGFTLALAVAGCDDDPANNDPICQPLAKGGECLLPWPSSFYETKDPSTATGLRVNLPAGVLPKTAAGVSMDPARLNLLDGWSPATTIVVNLKARITESQLPAWDRPESSLNSESRVQLLRCDGGDRVPVFAEIDKNPGAPPPAGQEQEHVLLIHPVIRLEPGTCYIVALVDIVDESGGRVHNEAFDALVKGVYPAGSRLESLRSRYLEIFERLSPIGVERSRLTLAWDFHTGSDTQLVGQLLTMRDTALKAWEDAQLQTLTTSYTLTASPSTPAGLHAQLLGTFDAPSFLVDNDLGAGLALDGSGKPIHRGMQKFNLVVHVPPCAMDPNRTKPLPLLLFGHGVLGAAQREMESAYQTSTINTLCMIEIGTDWIGLSRLDFDIVAGVMSDFGKFNVITDRLQQAQVNFLILAHLAVRKLWADPLLSPFTDGSEIYYFGISQGGILGNTLMALTPDIERGVLNVGGGQYSFMLNRAEPFETFKKILDGRMARTGPGYPSQRDQQVLLALSQSYWDWVDPITFVPYSLGPQREAGRVFPSTPLPFGRGKLRPRHLLLQESIGDTEVPNLATRVLVRTAGLPLLTPFVEEVYGVSPFVGSPESAYTQWSIMPSPVPGPFNTIPEHNDAHARARAIPQLIQQLGLFLRPDGRVVQTCTTGPCIFP